MFLGSFVFLLRKSRALLASRELSCELLGLRLQASEILFGLAAVGSVFDQVLPRILERTSGFQLLVRRGFTEFLFNFRHLGLLFSFTGLGLLQRGLRLFEPLGRPPQFALSAIHLLTCCFQVLLGNPFVPQRGVRGNDSHRQAGKQKRPEQPSKRMAFQSGRDVRCHISSFSPVYRGKR